MISKKCNADVIFVQSILEKYDINWASLFILVGHACTSGWKRGQVDKFVQYARQLLVERRLFHCMVEATLNKRIPEIRSVLQ